jgi:hypothetical protein
MLSLVVALVVIGIFLSACHFVAKQGKKRKIGYTLTFILTILLGPIFTLLIVSFSKYTEETEKSNPIPIAENNKQLYKAIGGFVIAVIVLHIFS